MFVDSFPYAVVLRFSLGIFHGVVPVADTAIVEILNIEKASIVSALTGAIW